MRIKLFSVYDSAVNTWLTPIPFKHSGDALRWFQELANGKDSNIGKYPHDFSLFELGEFDDQTAEVFMLQVPVKLGLAVEFLRTQSAGIAELREAVSPELAKLAANSSVN